MRAHCTGLTFLSRPSYSLDKLFFKSRLAISCYLKLQILTKHLFSDKLSEPLFANFIIHFLDQEENVFHSENGLGSPLYTIEESENEDLIPDFETNSD